MLVSISMCVFSMILKYRTLYSKYKMSLNRLQITIRTQLLPLLILSPLHNKQDSGHIDVANFSRFKDILD